MAALRPPRLPHSWLDFTNPRAVAWWGLLWRRNLTELGFDGGMLDLGELVTPDASPTARMVGRCATATHCCTPRRPSNGADLQAGLGLRALGSPVPRPTSTCAGRVIRTYPGGAGQRLPEHAAGRAQRRAVRLPYWHPEIGGYLAVGLPTASERELWRWLQRHLQQPAARHLRRPPDRSYRRSSSERRRDHRGLSTYARLHSSLVPYLYSYARIASEQPAADAAPGSTGRTIRGPGARSGSTPWATTCW